MKNNKTCRRHGFTLIEGLVCICIAAIFFCLVISSYQRINKKPTVFDATVVNKVQIVKPHGIYNSETKLFVEVRKDDDYIYVLKNEDDAWINKSGQLEMQANLEQGKRYTFYVDERPGCYPNIIKAELLDAKY